MSFRLQCHHHKEYFRDQGIHSFRHLPRMRSSNRGAPHGTGHEGSVRK
ncbi:MAG: hypothetical protein KBF11_01265 [Desulfomicrobium sp.]|nr:hypothetical protein [Desulfomicrobium sp.]